MNVVIRVDSSSLIGSGHLMRCLTLAQRYRKEGYNVAFVCRNLEGNLADLVNKQGFQLHMLLSAEQDDTLTGYDKWLTVTQEQDAAETIEILKKYGHIDRVVGDSYAIDEIWEKMVRPYADDIFVIDDLANRKHDCDILLDQNFYLNKDERYKGLVPKHCKLLLGPEHALLREEFYLAKEKMKPRDGKLHNILVFYGGADATNETSKAIEALSLLKSNGELQNVNITVVVGGSNTKRDGIANRCKQLGFKYLCQVNNMAELMAEANLMLGAGGTTLWERIFLGLPAIVTATAANQVEACECCSLAGYIYYIGIYSDVSSEDICREINKVVTNRLIERMQNKIIDYMS